MIDLQSPSPFETRMGFTTAIQQVAGGLKVRREPWGEDYYIFMDNGVLSIKKPEGTFGWVIKQEDLNAQDWIVI